MSWLNQHMLPSKWLGYPGAAPISPISLAGLIGWWSLDDATDAHTNELNLTNNNAATFASGKVGNAATFVRASSQYLSSSDSAFTLRDVDMSAACWFKANSDYANIQSLFGNIDGESKCCYDLEFGRTDSQFDWIQNGGSIDATWAATISDDDWHFIAVTREGTSGNWNLSLSVDGGAFETINTAVNSRPSLNGDFAIGSSGSGNGAPLEGSIDEFSIWTRVLPISDVAILYNSGVGLAYPG